MDIAVQASGKDQPPPPFELGPSKIVLEPPEPGDGQEFYPEMRTKGRRVPDGCRGAGEDD